MFQTLYASVINWVAASKKNISQTKTLLVTKVVNRLARIHITDLSVIVCFYKRPNVSPTRSLANNRVFLRRRLGLGKLCGIVIPLFIYLFFFFGQPSAGWGLLFTLLRPDSSQTLPFTPRGKRDRTLSVGSSSSWHRRRPPTKPDNDAPSAATKQADTTLPELMVCSNDKERHYPKTHKVNRKSNFFFFCRYHKGGFCSLSCTIPYKTRLCLFRALKRLVSLLRRNIAVISLVPPPIPLRVNYWKINKKKIKLRPFMRHASSPNFTAYCHPKHYAH